MNAQNLLGEILIVLKSVMNDKEKLQKILNFMTQEIYELPDEIEIHEKYKPLVPKIADSIEAGLICFLNPDTLEVEEVPQELIDEPEGFELRHDYALEDYNLKYTKWKRCISIEPPSSSESFRNMEAFAETLNDEKIKTKLLHALSRRRPFANFKSIVDFSDYRQDWFDFKKKHMEEYVKMHLLTRLDIDGKFVD